MEHEEILSLDASHLLSMLCLRSLEIWRSYVLGIYGIIPSVIPSMSALFTILCKTVKKYITVKTAVAMIALLSMGSDTCHACLYSHRGMLLESDGVININ